MSGRRLQSVVPEICVDGRGRPAVQDPDSNRGLWVVKADGQEAVFGIEYDRQITRGPFATVNACEAEQGFF